MPKPNYSFAKRQRDLAKKQKKEQKQQRKAALKSSPSPDDVPQPAADKTNES